MGGYILVENNAAFHNCITMVRAILNPEHLFREEGILKKIVN